MRNISKARGRAFFTPCCDFVLMGPKSLYSLGVPNQRPMLAVPARDTQQLMGFPNVVKVRG